VRAHDDGRRGASLPLVVSLHARGGDAAAGLSFARRLFGPDADVIALQAARPCNPFQSNLRAHPAYAGFSWYLGDDARHPEAASFGDALAQVDAFVRALDRSFVLAGEGQGGALALALACYRPCGLLGVCAPAGGFPVLAGWEVPPPVAKGDDLLLEAPADAAAWLQSRAGRDRSGGDA
jgi:predicted esterase